MSDDIVDVHLVDSLFLSFELLLERWGGQKRVIGEAVEFSQSTTKGCIVERRMHDDLACGEGLGIRHGHCHGSPISSKGERLANDRRAEGAAYAAASGALERKRKRTARNRPAQS